MDWHTAGKMAGKWVFGLKMKSRLGQFVKTSQAEQMARQRSLQPAGGTKRGIDQPQDRR